MQIVTTKDILDYKETVILGLDKREAICSGIGIAVIAGGYVILEKIFGGIGGSWIAILAGIPFFAFGFIKKDYMTLDKWIACQWRSKFSRPRQRLYVPELRIDFIADHADISDVGLTRKEIEKNARNYEKAKAREAKQGKATNHSAKHSR